MKHKAALAFAAVTLVIIGGYLIINHHNTKSRPKTPGFTHHAKPKKIGNELVNKEGEVFIDQNFFIPRKLIIKKGTQVIWTNLVATTHQVVADDGQPAGFKSPVLSKANNYSFKFKTAGEFSYHDGLHPEIKGTITVK